MMPWVYLSKDGSDEYINMMAQAAGQAPTSTLDFDYSQSTAPIIMRGILKHKLREQCVRDGRDFYYMDSGYFGNSPSAANPNGWKLWHRIVKNDVQHREFPDRPGDRLGRLGIAVPKQRRSGSHIIVAVPDDKPCRVYGIDRKQWVDHTVAALKQSSDRPIVVRERVPSRQYRTITEPLSELLKDAWALVTFNSTAAIEAVLAGVPAFVSSPVHAADPVANRDLALIESPFWPDTDEIQRWLRSLSYGQFHVSELRDGTAQRILESTT
jgi:hypothetical protein